jgi:endoglucanase
LNTKFLESLLDAPGPSGFEVRAARVWREEAELFADKVWTDVHGNTFAAVNPDARPRVMLAGHIDEIGLQVTHIDEHGYLYFDGIGGWDPQVLVGQRVRVMTRNGDVAGVVGKKAIHLIEADERSKASKIKDLWVDVGASDLDGALGLGVRVGDPMVLWTGVMHLAGDRIVSRAIDNRIGAFVVLEALRLLSETPAAASTVAVATAQEEIGYSGGGARTSAYQLEPDVALVVDVTFSTDVPDISKKEHGDHKIGGGPVIARGSAAHAGVVDRLVEVAEAEGIPFTLQAQPKATRTDADAIFLVRSGVPTGLVSVPNRYMHSPNELVSLSDLERAARLLAAFVRRLGAEADFRPL